MSNFEILLKKMENQRKLEREEYYKSAQSQLDNIQIDFKCWCFSRGKFYNINEYDFKKYKETFNLKFTRAFETEIYTRWFGYVFETDQETLKMRTKKNNHWVLNRKVGQNRQTT